MYDSDEVRDAVRSDALAVFMHWTGAFRGFADLPPLDQAAIGEALAAKGNPWQPVLRDYLSSLERASRRPWVDSLERFAETVVASFRELFDEMLKAVRPLLDKLREASVALRDSLTELAEAIGAVEAREPEPFVWQQRPRQPDVQPVQSVDAVAAGRSPSAWFRTRIRGGRR
jgi:transcriptional regulator with XRE-family HTH domain